MGKGNCFGKLFQLLLEAIHVANRYLEAIHVPVSEPTRKVDVSGNMATFLGMCRRFSKTLSKVRGYGSRIPGTLRTGVKCGINPKRNETLFTKS
jgi:hypothetical protein